MKKIYIRNTIVSLAFLLSLTSAVMYKSGASGGYTNAPGEKDCTDCHSGSLITSGNSNLNKIRLNPNFTKGGYEIDSTYEIELTCVQKGISRWGFEVTCLNSSTDLAEGTFSTSNNRVRTTIAYIGGKKRNYVVQTSTGSSSTATDSVRWVFKWKAPSSNVGKVKFYITTNAANDDNKDGGDDIYAKVFEFGCASGLPTAEAYTNDSVTCTNTNVNFIGSGTNSPTSYSWKFTGAIPSSSNSKNPTVKFVQAGKQYAILTTSSSSGTSLPDTMEITVNQSPGASIIGGYYGTICEGDSLLISANSSSTITHYWNPGGQTSTSIYVKNIGAYSVTNTSTINGCKGTSSSFVLSHHPTPSISITGKTSPDTICGNYKDNIYVSGNNLDSVIWYVNGKVYARNQSNTLAINASSDIEISAIGKSNKGCVTPMSNVIKKYIVKKLTPSLKSFSKTSSSITLNWRNQPGIDSITYSINGSSYSNIGKDSNLTVSNLNSNSFYGITLRTYQKSPCNYIDTSILVKTNSCSGLSYTINSKPRLCKGETLDIEVNGLYATKYSLSFEGGAYQSDTIFSIPAIQSDSFSISIIDSLSGNCPALKDVVSYEVDSMPYEKPFQDVVYSCDNIYTLKRSPNFLNYEYFRNGNLLYSGTDNSYNFTNLNYGDTLRSFAVVNACSKSVETVFELNSTFSANYQFSRTKSDYTFTANDTTATGFKWYLGTTLVGQSNPLLIDLYSYSEKEIEMTLQTFNQVNCFDTFKQNIQLPKFTSIQTVDLANLSVYPNPTENKLTIELSDNSSHKYSITSIDGRSISAGTFEGKVELDLSNYSKGYYILKVGENGNSVYKPIILK
ncbi:MAG: choice-of-anchor V domain-containing protein [Bacteroidia bacterium]